MSHPLLNAFWMIFWFFLWIMWFMLLFRVFADLFRDHKLSGWAKAGWIIFVCVLPFIGVFIYLIVRGHGMGDRDVAQARQSQEQLDDYIRKTAGSSGGNGASDTGAELTRLAGLKDSGVLSEEEFQRAKEKVLA
ncbi:hypothetical protein ABIA35_005190 [Catenulispora sp. MAP12-49]|uniref:SHOCT domain-containing protein n=1 Tax=unclassified Catenulispora TaxID=414885 RepID=UPI0035180C00